ncbi:RxLR effector protein [Phytophthora megakarya]|uniref:RxLR effector protein n=1 Tax=Phytophthora megakarya TaxID=4795 RepID=A0A225WUQ9_9STRA|nr:RxLR effector protein [Phytophthora megakarya]
MLVRIAVLATSLVCVGCCSGTTTLKMTPPASGPRRTENYQSVEHKRMLRAYTTTEHSAEERAYPEVLTSGKLKFNKWMAGSTLRNAKKMAKLWTHTDDFNKGKIATEKISVTGSLMEKYGDDVVMAAIVKAKQVDSTKRAATKLETDLILNYAKIFKRAIYQGKDIDDVLTKGLGGENKVLPIIATAMREPSLTKTKMEELKKLETKLLVQKLENQRIFFQIDDRMKSIMNSPGLVYR